MLFLKILFWLSVVGAVLKVFHCCSDHPRVAMPTNVGTDIVLLLESVAMAFFLWAYTFGGWIIR